MNPADRAKGIFTGQSLSPELARVVRLMGLYPLARRTLYATDCARNYSANRTLKQQNPGVAFPPRKLLWTTAPTTSYRVYLTGREAAGAFYDLAAQHLPEIRKIYEWGSGAGSVIRHMPALDPRVEAYGSDYESELVRWCQAHVPDVTFSLNGLEPPLAFDDNSFDFVYSRSVYTHLSAGLQKNWLAEQLRVTRPGGLVLLTVHGDAYKHRLTREDLVEYETTGVVEHRGADDGGPWFTTFNSPSYMERELLAGLTVVYRDLLPEEACGLRQDLWLVRNPA